MIQLILHLLGDYVFQNQWMTENKTKKSLKGIFAALLHSLIYSILFFIFLINWKGLIVIFISHLIIDKYDIARLWVRIINNAGKRKVVNNGIRIVVDNTFHLIINYFVIIYFSKSLSII